jgi:hypothetical protein
MFYRTALNSQIYKNETRQMPVDFGEKLYGGVKSLKGVAKFIKRFVISI